jgi:hypothetical protein
LLVAALSLAHLGLEAIQLAVQKGVQVDGRDAANAGALVSRLDEESSVEMRDVVLFDGTPMKFRL